MILLYWFLGLMCLIAVGLVFLTLLRHSFKQAMTLFVIGIVISLTALALYRFNTDTDSLRHWVTTGKTHYDLMVQFNELGGIDGMIERVKHKLAINPDDQEGQEILKKLYQMKQKQ